MAWHWTGITEAQKDAMRRERSAGRSYQAIATNYGCTRQRVHQICSEPPDEQKRAAEIALGLDESAKKQGAGTLI